MQVVINKDTIINPVKANTCISVYSSFLVDPEESVASVGLVSGVGGGLCGCGLDVGSDGGDGGVGEGVCGGNGGGGNGAVLVHALGGPSVEVEPSIRAYAPNQAVAP